MSSSPLQFVNACTYTHPSIGQHPMEQSKAEAPDMCPQIHALFLRVSFPGFSDRRSRPFRINVVITLAVRKRMYLHTSLHRPAPYGTIESRGARYVPHRLTRPKPCAPSCWQVLPRLP